MKKNSKTRSRRGFDGRKKLMEDFKQQRVILISGIASGLTELQRKSAGQGCLRPWTKLPCWAYTMMAVAIQQVCTGD